MFETSVIKMSYVVDLQGFKSSGNTFVCKEVAVVTLADEVPPSVFLFLPPYKWSDLEVKHKSENKWLEHNYLGIPWSAGFIPYEAMQDVLMNVLKDAQKVYVKGTMKKKFLQDFHPNVENLEYQGCPSLKTLRDREIMTLCSFHSLCMRPMCAVNNALLLKSWMIQDKRISTYQIHNKDGEDTVDFHICNKNVIDKINMMYN